MQLSRQDFTGATLLIVECARVDAAVAVQFKDMVREMSQQGGERVILDMSNVTFLDSSGLGAVVAAMKQLGRERSLELAGLTPAVKKVFRLTRMDKVFKVHATVGSAVDGLAQAS